MHNNKFKKTSNKDCWGLGFFFGMLPCHSLHRMCNGLLSIIFQVRPPNIKCVPIVVKQPTHLNESRNSKCIANFFTPVSCVYTRYSQTFTEPAAGVLFHLVETTGGSQFRGKIGVVNETSRDHMTTPIQVSKSQVQSTATMETNKNVIVITLDTVFGFLTGKQVFSMEIITLHFHPREYLI